MTENARRLARGEPSAFRALYDTTGDRLHHYATARLGSRADADDVVQETFMRLVRAGKDLERVRDLTAFIFAIARNETNRLLQDRARRGLREPGVTAENLFDETGAADVERREAAETAATLLSVLSEDQREVVELKLFAGLTFREIAEVLDRPQGTVATRYRSALERMRLASAREET